MKTLCVTSICVLLFSIAYSVEAATLRAVDYEGDEQNTFENKDDIYVEGSCFGAEGETVRVYVVEDKSSWPSGTALTDVSGGAEIVTIDNQGEIPLTKVWSGPLDDGEYDIVVDVDGNGVRNSGEVCIDSVSNKGFLVLKKPTNLIVAAIDEHFKSPNDHVWTKGVDGNDHVLLIFELKNNDKDKESIRLTEMELEARGSGDDVSSIDEVLVILDTDTSETYNKGDDVVGRGFYKKNNGRLHIEIFEQLKYDEPLQFLIVYRFGDAVQNAEIFQVHVRDVEGYGVSSASVLDTRPLPLRSAEVVVRIPDGTNTSLEDDLGESDTNGASGPFEFGSTKNDLQGDVTREPLSFDFGDGLSLKTRAIILGLVILLILWRLCVECWRWLKP